MAFQDAIVDQLIRQNDTDDGGEVTLEGYFEAGFFTETFGWGLTRFDLTLGILIGMAILLMPCIVRCFCRPLKKKAATTPSKVDDEVVARLPVPGTFLLQEVALVLFLTVTKVPESIVETFRPMLLILIVGTSLWFLSRAVEIFSKVFSTPNKLLVDPAGDLNDDASPLMSRIMKIVILGLVAVIGLQALGLDVSALVAGLGIGGLAVGLAFQNTLANMFASAVIFSDQPFELGDAIEFGGISGTVEGIGLRSTRIRGYDGSLTLVPNSKLETGTLTNYFRNSTSRFRCWVQVDAHPVKLSSFVRDARSLIASFPGLKKGTNPYSSVYVIDTNGVTAKIEFKVYMAAGPLSDSKKCQMLTDLFTAEIEARVGAYNAAEWKRSKKQRKAGEEVDAAMAKETGEEGKKKKLAESTENSAAGTTVALGEKAKANQKVKASWDYYPAFILFREAFMYKVIELLDRHEITAHGDQLITVESLTPAQNPSHGSHRLAPPARPEAPSM